VPITLYLISIMRPDGSQPTADQVPIWLSQATISSHFAEVVPSNTRVAFAAQPYSSLGCLQEACCCDVVVCLLYLRITSPHRQQKFREQSINNSQRDNAAPMAALLMPMAYAPVGPLDCGNPGYPMKAHWMHRPPNQFQNLPATAPRPNSKQAERAPRFALLSWSDEKHLQRTRKHSCWEDSRRIAPFVVDFVQVRACARSWRAKNCRSPAGASVMAPRLL